MPRTTKKTTTPIEKQTIPTVPAAEQPYQVPENWRWVYIRTGFDVTSSKRVHKNDWLSEGIPFYRTRELVKLSENGFVDNELFISQEFYNECKDNYGVPNVGDLLISGVGTIGVPYIVNNNNPFYFKDGNIIWFKNKGLFIPEFIFYLYKSDFMFNQIHNMSAGTTVDTYTIVNAMKTLLPFPPLAEQQRIVDRIERLFAKLDEAREKAQAVVDGFENRKAAILHQAFTGELTRKWREERGIGMESWTSVIMNSVLDVRDGTHDSPKYFDIGYPLVTSKNLKNGMITDKDIKYISKDDYDKINERSKVDKGDVLFAMIGTIGNPVVVEDEPVYAIKNVALFKNIGKINPYFVRYYLESKTVIDKMEREAKGSTQKFVSLGYLRNFIISKPSDLEQNKVVQLINHLLTSERRARDLAESVIAQIDGMKKAILARAFRGELGTNDPSESACEG